MRYNTVIRTEHAVGDFAIESTPLAWAEAEAGPELTSEVNAAILIGHTRTIEQDPLFGIRQIVDVALKALSPSINETTTAVTCIDHLTAVLLEWVRQPPPACAQYRAGALCLITRESDFSAALDLAFDQIRQNSRGNVAVAMRQLRSIERLARHGGSREHDALRRHANLIAAAAEAGIPSAPDLQPVRDQYGAALSAIEAFRTGR
jgi:uncharacterized membrane protein